MTKWFCRSCLQEFWIDENEDLNDPFYEEEFCPYCGSDDTECIEEEV
jgi:rRNA maturation endonuclease Nob1